MRWAVTVVVVAACSRGDHEIGVRAGSFCHGVARSLREQAKSLEQAAALPAETPPEVRRRALSSALGLGSYDSRRGYSLPLDQAVTFCESIRTGTSEARELAVGKANERMRETEDPAVAAKAALEIADGLDALDALPLVE